MLLDLDTSQTIELGAFKPVVLPVVARVDLGTVPVESPVLLSGELRIEQTAREELDAVRAGIGACRKQSEAFDNATDSVYWMCVCFQSRAQLVEWLTKSRLMHEIDGQYIDGRKVAERMGINLESPNLPKRTHRVDRRLSELTDG